MNWDCGGAYERPSDELGLLELDNEFRRGPVGALDDGLLSLSSHFLFKDVGSVEGLRDESERSEGSDPLRCALLRASSLADFLALYIFSAKSLVQP